MSVFRNRFVRHPTASSSKLDPLLSKAADKKLLAEHARNHPVRVNEHPGARPLSAYDTYRHFLRIDPTSPVRDHR